MISQYQDCKTCNSVLQTLILCFSQYEQAMYEKAESNVYTSHIRMFQESATPGGYINQVTLSKIHPMHMSQICKV
jgi:hypothetical protein